MNENFLVKMSQFMPCHQRNMWFNVMVIEYYAFKKLIAEELLNRL